MVARATSRRSLPQGVTPRVLSHDAAAEYCGVVRETFDKTIRPFVPPLELCARRLWDKKALDRFLDLRSGLIDDLPQADDYLDRLDETDTARYDHKRARG
jgi:hypothetical protein